ncbi:hypothetical protein ACJJTC_003970 [Scirpophaga incertulas]
MSRFETNLDFYCFLREGDFKNYKRFDAAILASIPLDISQEDSEAILKFERSISASLSRRWTTANRTRKIFFNKYMSWLEEEIKWPVCNSLNLVEIYKETIDLEEESPLLIYVDSAYLSTSRETKDVTTSTEEELSFALVANLKKNKRMALAEVIEHLMKNPDQAPGVKAYLTPRKTIIQADQALALPTSLNCSNGNIWC